MIIHEKFSDFVLFLYVHMAYADGGLHRTEKEVILAKMKKLFPDESNPGRKLQAVEKQYLDLDSRKIGELIASTFEHFKQIKFSQKYKVYADMYDIINADGVVDESETAALSELKKIIDMNAGSKR